MTPKMPEEHADYRRKQILDAAWTCFTEKGYNRTTIRDIAQAMNLSTGIIYNYFDGKDDIIAALHELSMEGKKRIFERLSRQETAKAALGELFTLCLTSQECGALRKGARGDIGMWAEALRHKKLARLFGEQLRFLRTNLAGVIGERIEEGEIRPGIDAGHAADAYIALLIGLTVIITFIDDFDVPTFTENLDRMLLENIWQ